MSIKNLWKLGVSLCVFEALYLSSPADTQEEFTQGLISYVKVIYE